MARAIRSIIRIRAMVLYCLIFDEYGKVMECVANTAQNKSYRKYKKVNFDLPVDKCSDELGYAYHWSNNPVRKQPHVDSGRFAAPGLEIPVRYRYYTSSTCTQILYASIRTKST